MIPIKVSATSALVEIGRMAQDQQLTHGLPLQRPLRRRGWHDWADAMRHLAVAAISAFALGSAVCGCLLLLKPA